MLYSSLSMRLSSNAVNQFGKSMFCSDDQKPHLIILVSKLDKQLWPLLFRCRDPHPWKPNLWWETEQNALIAAGFAASGVMISSQLLADCPCSIIPCSTCKADGYPVPLWQTHFICYPCPFFDQELALEYVMPHIDLVWVTPSCPYQYHPTRGYVMW